MIFYVVSESSICRICSSSEQESVTLSGAENYIMKLFM